MTALGNTTCTVLRGTTPDAWGDVTDAGAAPVVAEVSAAIVESARRVTDPATQTPRTIRTITAVVPAWTGVLTTDRLRDQAGCVYIVEAVTVQPSLGYPGDLLLDLRRVTDDGP